MYIHTHKCFHYCPLQCTATSTQYAHIMTHTDIALRDCIRPTLARGDVSKLNLFAPPTGCAKATILKFQTAIQLSALATLVYLNVLVLLLKQHIIGADPRYVLPLSSK